jgi:hypothetical protein
MDFLDHKTLCIVLVHQRVAITKSNSIHFLNIRASLMKDPKFSKAFSLDCLIVNFFRRALYYRLLLINDETITVVIIVVYLFNQIKFN